MKRLGLVKDDAHDRDKAEEFDNWKPSITAIMTVPSFTDCIDVKCL